MSTPDFSEFGQNAWYVEELYNLFRVDPTLVSEKWATYFGQSGGYTPQTNGSTHTNGKHLDAPPQVSPAAAASTTRIQKYALKLIAAYRSYGYLKARNNPLSRGINVPPLPKELDTAAMGITTDDLSKPVVAEELRGAETRTLGDLIDRLEQIYCGPIGFEYMHLLSTEQREWLQQKIEARAEGWGLTRDVQQRILLKLIATEHFEAELHRKYVGAKRFSVQGLDSLVPLLDHLVEVAAQSGVREAVVGMAHRGRLNVLTNVLGKPLEKIFSEFEDLTEASILGFGDVKYHLGYQGTRRIESGAEIEMRLVPNPSHLEFVGSVVEGVSRSRQDLGFERERRAVLPILVHGDAAVIGQGIVFETYNLCAVPGYATGGTVHVVANNQVGFTTEPSDSRSSVYCTDPAKGFEVPIFRVNAEDPEACCWIAALALEFRNKFERDVVIDLCGYRKYGHNEGDDPTFTQPVIYSEVKTKQAPYQIYAEKLEGSGAVSKADIESAIASYKERFKRAQPEAAKGKRSETRAGFGLCSIEVVSTSVNHATLREVAQLLTKYPQGFTPHPKLVQILDKRVETLEAGEGIDWGFAEALAFGTLVKEGIGVRLSGQDCGRGTFSQRHLALTDFERGGRFFPLAALDNGTSRFEVYNSTLSEAAVLGFEFGYSSVAPKTLVLWEAQFGDFANGAQVIIDQFLAASEVKWDQLSGVTLLLPHGYEGQGPEHSSARLERFLQLCADNNMSVCYPSTAAQHFHLMRRQGLSEVKRPLVEMTPKSLLRHPGAAARAHELSSGSFRPVISDDFGDSPKHLVCLSGKLFYDLEAAFEKEGIANGVRVLRIEELYPFPGADIARHCKETGASRIIWAQEEPKNMGAWSFVAPHFAELAVEVVYAGRPACASTATGSGKRHTAEQQQIIATVRELCAARGR